VQSARRRGIQEHGPHVLPAFARFDIQQELAMRTILTLLLGFVTAAACCAADNVSQQSLENWAQWRGPLATGVAPLAHPPLHWDDNTNIKWKVKIPGDGDGSPIVWGDKIFLITAVKTDRPGKPEPEPQPKFAPQEAKPAAKADANDGQPDAAKKPAVAPSRGFRGYGITTPEHYYKFVVLCLDRQSGRTLWEDVAAEAVPHEGHHPDGSFASASPSTDGKLLFVSFGSRGVYCYDLAGKKKWSRDLGRMWIMNMFGEGSSPVIHGDSVILNWDHQGESFLYCLDAATGETRWKIPRDPTSTWATPLVVDSNGNTQVIVHGTPRVRSYDLKTGELLWACGGQGPSAIPTPVTDGRTVYAMTGFITNSLFAIPLDATGDISNDDKKIAWKSRKIGTPYVPSPLIYGELLYFTVGNRGLLTVVDSKTGEVLVDRQRLEGAANIYASPVGAEDRIYIASRDGTTVVVERGRFETSGDKKAVPILATNKLDDQFDASPALAGSQLFLRGREHLYCISAE
jgi:outer membrane protein assembly factor BamB